MPSMPTTKVNFNEEPWVDLLALSGLALQQQTARVLRKLAIEHLQTSKTPVAEAFRAEYVAAQLGPQVNEFLKAQSKNQAWGTYIEATALAERFGVHLVVLPIKNGVEQEPVSLYRTENDNAPVIILRNKDNQHWESRNGSTLGDGNCLYNAFAQELKLISNQDLQIDNAETKQAVQQQQQAFNTYIKSQPKPSVVKQVLENEKARIAKLSPEEQQQIADDHAYALQLAVKFSNEAMNPLQTACEKKQPVPTHTGTPRLVHGA